MKNLLTAAMLFVVCAAGAEDWTGAAWIGGDSRVPTDAAGFYRDEPNTVLRRMFSPRGKVASARLEIVGLGCYDAVLNGRRLTPTAFPNWTPYAKRVLFDVFDVTDALVAGTNTLTVSLGNGWYNPLPLRMWGHLDLRRALTVGTPCLKARLLLRFADGSAEAVVTDARMWQASPGRVLRNNFYLGEVQDARRAAGPWTAAREVAGPAGRLVPREVPPIVVRTNWTAVGVRELGRGAWVADLGVNFGGMARFRIRGARPGTVVRFRYGELLRKDGTVNVMTAVCGQIKASGRGGPGAPDLAEPCDTYVCAGSAEETFEPRFSFHSFRYVQIEGDIAPPRPGDVEALACSTAVAGLGTFRCSDDRLNRVHEMCRRTFLSNLMGVQSDCPGREKFGYGGDIAATADAFFLSFDMAAFYRKTVRDFLDEAADDGWFTETAPYVGIGDGGSGGRGGPVGWTVAVPIMLDALVRYAGDANIVAEAYPACARYLDLLRTRHPDLVIASGIGDHEALDKAPIPLTATAHFYQWAALTAKFARLLGKENEAAKYGALADAIGDAFRRRFVRDGKVGPGGEGVQVFGLYHGLVPAAERNRALELLKQAVAAARGAPTTGIFGTKYLFDVLPREGASVLAGQIATHEGVPGWFAMLDAGATTLWEHWEGSDDTFSQNHPMFGTVEEWLMEDLLGISVPADAVGCDTIRIAPHAVGGVTWAEGSYRTPRGVVHVAWKLVDGKMRITTDVPAGVTVRGDAESAPVRTLP